MDAMTTTLKRAITAARKHDRTAYIIPTAYGPRITWEPAPFGARCIAVSPSGQTHEEGGLQ